jgi:hypothetical protein
MLATELGRNSASFFLISMFSEREEVMTRKYTPYFSVFLALVWFGVFPGLALGQTPEQSAQQIIEENLAKKGSFEFTDTPLSNFVSLLREKYSMNVVIDYRALKDKNIGEDSPVTINLKNVTVRSALELAIRPLGLNWTIYCEALVISTPAAIQSMQFNRVYDITDLVMVAGEQGKTWEEPDTFIDLITSTASPESWENTGGHGTIQLVSTGAARLLVVSQDYRVQRQVADLLSELRNVAKQHASTSRQKTEPDK